MPFTLTLPPKIEVLLRQRAESMTKIELIERLKEGVNFITDAEGMRGLMFCSKKFAI